MECNQAVRTPRVYILSGGNVKMMVAFGAELYFCEIKERKKNKGALFPVYTILQVLHPDKFA
jgi:hypothetical protein